MHLPDRMAVEGATYAVTMSRSTFNWLVRGVVGPALDAGPSAWPHGGRLAYGRLETLATRCKHVEVRQRGRVTRWTSKDARTVLALLEAARVGIVTRAPPASAAALELALRWQVGELRDLPGQVPERVARAGWLVNSRGEYIAGALDGLGPGWRG